MIRARNITKLYDEGVTTQALRGIDLYVRPGDFVSIMGPSGSGKSSLLNILGCLDTPTSGDYALLGRDVLTLSSAAKAKLRNECIGFVFQSFFLIPQLTAAQNVELPLIYRGDPAAVRRELVARSLNALGLYDRRSHLSTQLSGGQRQRVAIARALVCNPRLVLADEPTGNLDEASGAEVMRVICALHDTGVTVVLITHSPEIAARADRCMVLTDGRLFEAVR